MFEPLSQDAQREGLHFSHGFRLVGTVAEHAREVRDFGDPAAIFLTFELNLEGHKGTLAPGWLPHKALQPTSGSWFRLLRVNVLAARGIQAGEVTTGHACD